MINSSFKMDKVVWQDISQAIHTINPTLASIIDHLSPNNAYPLIKVTYPYGSEILKNGVLYLPDENRKRLLSITDSDTKKELKALLGYNENSNPVALLMKNSAEIFFQLNTHTIPLYGFLKAGSISGTWRILSQQPETPTFLWNMTAGARSLMMLPKISEKKAHRRLQKSLGIKSDPPKSLLDHWKIFREIANINAPNHQWNTTLLFFTRPWFSRLDDPAWLPFHHYLLNRAWQGSEHWRNQIFWDIIYSLLQKRYDIKCDSYIDDTVRHLLSIATGGMAGFAPATDESLAPINCIQQAYIEHYRLKRYAPTIIQPCCIKDNEPVYYSLRYPSTARFSNKSNTLTSNISDLYLIHSLLKKYLHFLQNDNSLNICNNKLYDRLQQIDFNYYHSYEEQYSNIAKSTDIRKFDHRFTACSRGGNQDFAFNSPFFTGCIAINKTTT